MNFGGNLTNNMNFAVLFLRYEENKLGIVLYPFLYCVMYYEKHTIISFVVGCRRGGAWNGIGDCQCFTSWR